MTDHLDPRQSLVLRHGWRFARMDDPHAAYIAYDDADWQQVRVPHDWAIGGAFDKTTDKDLGRTGGLPHVGVGWYRQRFVAPQTWTGKRVFVEFDGVMSRSTVYVNGHEVGSWPYGYSSFAFEITDYLQCDTENVLAVRVDNKPAASRWYPGAGLYRYVRLVIVDPVHVAHWGTTVTTPEITVENAVVAIRTEVTNSRDVVRAVELTSTILDPQGVEIATGTSVQTIAAGHTQVYAERLTVEAPQLWDVNHPQLYRLVSRLYVDGHETDCYETRFGIRTLRFDANEGFFLNGRGLKLQGVCQHHDLGALGSAVHPRAIERQLELLKEMGCNAIRTSHNPPAPELLDLCDTMGFLVIDEAFDEWRIRKVENGYHQLFDAWAEKDLQAMIRRDRNHPCIIMWSIGNEVPDQRHPSGAETARFLTEICHEEDPTRPVTAGFDSSDEAIANGLADAVDIPGWNYKCHLYEKYHAEHPEWVMYGSETESCVSSRGEYFLPVEPEKGVQRPSLHCTAYDVAAPPWGYVPDAELTAQADCPFILGQFTWTGFDYLGEPTPYQSKWPSRSSYFGIIDLCGIRKDRYYLYRSAWSDEPTLHLLPHWNWAGHEGQPIPVHCYTSYPTAELFLNGRSLGIRTKGTQTSELGKPFTRWRLIWDDVPYEPGTLEVVAFDADGKPAMTAQMHTAGAPVKIELLPDREEIKADGEDLSFITVRITDAAGHLCPHAAQRISFRLEGAAEIAAIDNGDPTSLEPFCADSRRTFHGMCMLIVRSQADESGPVHIAATADGLAPTEISIVATPSS